MLGIIREWVNSPATNADVLAVVFVVACILAAAAHADVRALAREVRSLVRDEVRRMRR